MAKYSSSRVGPSFSLPVLNEWWKMAHDFFFSLTLHNIRIFGWWKRYQFFGMQYNSWFEIENWWSHFYLVNIRHSHFNKVSECKVDSFLWFLWHYIWVVAATIGRRNIRRFFALNLISCEIHKSMNCGFCYLLLRLEFT